MSNVMRVLGSQFGCRCRGCGREVRVKWRRARWLSQRQSQHVDHHAAHAHTHTTKVLPAHGNAPSPYAKHYSAAENALLPTSAFPRLQLLSTCLIIQTRYVTTIYLQRVTRGLLPKDRTRGSDRQQEYGAQVRKRRQRCPSRFQWSQKVEASCLGASSPALTVRDAGRRATAREKTRKKSLQCVY